MRLDVSFEFFGGVRLCETIGVLAFGKQEDFDVESLGKKHVDAAQGGVNPRGVAVIQHGDVFREPVNESHLLFCE